MGGPIDDGGLAARWGDDAPATPTKAWIMTLHTAIERVGQAEASSEIHLVVPLAARCWRAARDAGAPVQQRLHKLLSPLGFDMLPPVFDSLLTLWESALGRRFVSGEPSMLSRDERLLLVFLDPAPRAVSALIPGKGAGFVLRCAIASTRIMLARAREHPLALRKLDILPKEIDPSQCPAGMI